METVVALFEGQVKRTPDKIALKHNDEALSYDELNRQANQLAHYLQFLGVQPEYLVGVCLPRSIEMLVAILGILKAGAAYVALDPCFPEKRLAYMLEDSQLKCLLLTQKTQQTLSKLMPEANYCSIDLEQDAAKIDQQPHDNLSLPISCNHLAYCLYTSGSTGRPKAVLMEHLSLANLIHWHLKHRITPARQLQFSPISFDISAQEIFATWCSGGCLFSIEEQTRRNPVALLEFIDTHKIEKLYLPFTPLQQLAAVAHDCGNYPGSVKEVITAGERLQITAAIRAFFQHTQATLHHHYGSTECQDVTALTMSGSPETWPLLPSVGKPIDNLQTYILDETRQPVASGEIGKLFIGGDGLARGFLHRPELTAKKFIPNPFGEGRLYDTSDNARYLPTGDIELLGRSDAAVKIRGFRVELGEIEANLLQHEAINQAVVVVHEDEAKHKRLVAYLILHSETNLSAQQLRDYLAQSLPDYMIPAVFMFMSEFPLTPTGKADRKLLPPPRFQYRPESVSQPFAAPRTPLEQKIALDWQIVLHIDEISIYDNFYELGGDSLLLISLYTQLNKQFTLPLHCLLQNLTIAQLAQVIEQHTALSSCIDNNGLSVSQLQSLAVLPLETVSVYQPSPQPPNAVLLTGATGFFGAFLLNHLLDSLPETQIYCLVRSVNENQARQRILDSQHRYGLNLNDRALQRLHALSGAM